MAKTIFILLDGCGYKVATENLGYAEHLVEAGIGAKYKILGELPSSSRPLYETLHTGLPVHQHGIASNALIQKSKSTSIFDLCHTNGMVTAAAAYFWISELYVRVPFNLERDRIQLHSESCISHGIYYYEDLYPDSHVFSDGEFLRNTFHPEYLLIHSMNIDDAGHKRLENPYGYQRATAKVNAILSYLMPTWLEEGYQVVISSDHGMGADGLHGGNTEEQRLVPLYLFSPKVKKGNFSEKIISQLCFAPLLCRLLEIEPTPQMKDLSEIGVDIFEK